MAPKPGEIKALYRAFLKEGSKFPNYNVREYVKRKTREQFRLPEAPEAVDGQWQKGLADFELVRRQAIVYSLYQRKHKSIMDLPFKAVLQESAAALDRPKDQKG
eukprot:jgi/Botrbrau1/17804/Bobra.0127s0053.1